MIMSFTYDREKLAAVDKSRCISIKRGGRPWADSEPVIYKFIYVSKDVSFNFGALSHEQIRTFVRDGKKVERSVCLAIDVFEPSIETGLRFARFRCSSEKLAEIKANIKEGMFELCAQRDPRDKSPLVPEFTVNFIANVAFRRRKIRQNLFDSA
jgi:hypothetical protein